ncbi:MAG: phosphatidylglycerophosphatase A [Lysobacterales bacterium]|jgi:phosphatidylglycerophosphatase A
MNVPPDVPDPDRRGALRSVSGFLALGFGSGLSPAAPGTAGTLAAVPLAALLVQLPPLLFWPVLAALFLIGVYVCGHTSRRLGRHDPGSIVWDEMVGYWLVVAFVPMHWAWWLAAFLLFRFFDIVKPWPIRWLDRRVGGGFGIMLDDVVAGVFATVVLLIAQRLVAL